MWFSPPSKTLPQLSEFFTRAKRRNHKMAVRFPKKILFNCSSRDQDETGKIVIGNRQDENPNNKRLLVFLILNTGTGWEGSHSSRTGTRQEFVSNLSWDWEGTGIFSYERNGTEVFLLADSYCTKLNCFNVPK